MKRKPTDKDRLIEIGFIADHAKAENALEAAKALQAYAGREFKDHQLIRDGLAATVKQLEAKCCVLKAAVSAMKG